MMSHSGTAMYGRTMAEQIGRDERPPLIDRILRVAPPVPRSVRPAALDVYVRVVLYHANMKRLPPPPCYRIVRLPDEPWVMVNL